MRCRLRIRRGKKTTTSYPEYPKLTPNQAYGKSVKPYQLSVPLVGVPLIHVGFCIDKSWKWGRREVAHVHKTEDDPAYNHMCFNKPDYIFDVFGEPSKYLYHEFGHVLHSGFSKDVVLGYDNSEAQEAGHANEYIAIMEHMGKPELASRWI